MGTCLSFAENSRPGYSTPGGVSGRQSRGGDSLRVNHMGGSRPVWDSCDWIHLRSKQVWCGQWGHPDYPIPAPEHLHHSHVSVQGQGTSIIGFPYYKMQFLEKETGWLIISHCHQSTWISFPGLNWFLLEVSFNVFQSKEGYEQVQHLRNLCCVRIWNELIICLHMLHKGWSQLIKLKRSEKDTLLNEFQNQCSGCADLSTIVMSFG